MDRITCAECGKQIEPLQKSRGWENWSTADARVCEGCWDTEMDRVLKDVKSCADLTAALMEIKFPLRTFIGRAAEDDTIQKVIEKFSVSKT